jgi:hypothetical protein
MRICTPITRPTGKDQLRIRSLSFLSAARFSRSTGSHFIVVVALRLPSITHIRHSARAGFNFISETFSECA